MSELTFINDYPGSNIYKCETNISICTIIYSGEQSRVSMYNNEQTIVGKLKMKFDSSNDMQDKVKPLFQLFNDCLLDTNFINNCHWVDILKHVKIIELENIHAAMLDGGDSFIYSDVGENFIFWLDPIIKENARFKFILDFCVKYNELLGVEKIQEISNG
jgi:hypothetical protein